MSISITVIVRSDQNDSVIKKDSTENEVIEKDKYETYTDKNRGYGRYYGLGNY